MNKFSIRLKAYVTVLQCRMYKMLYKQPVVMTEAETVDYILNHRCSVGRLGDGELDIMLGIKWKKSFQKYDPDLSKKLRQLKTDDRFLLCIPDVMMSSRFSEDIITKKEYDFWRINLHQFEGGVEKICSIKPGGRKCIYFSFLY